MAQIGQTEPQATPGDYPKAYNVRREVKFVQNTRHFIIEIRHLTNFYLNGLVYFDFAVSIKRLCYEFLLHCVVCVFFYTYFFVDLHIF